MHLRTLINAIVSIVFLLVNINAQQAPTPRSETGLALEVVYLQGRPPAYQQFSLSSSKKAGAWYALFGRIAGWQLPVDALPVKAVRLTPYLEGDTVFVRVSVLRGVKFPTSEEMVATYEVRENEKKRVEELRNLGVEPFELKVIRVAPATPAFPSILNETKSVEVVGAEPLIATLPRYKLTLQNLADKNIAALGIETRGEGKIQIISLPFGRDGEPLIKGRDHVELIQPLGTRAQATPAGYAPSSPPVQQIVITSLVFEDGSCEGEVEPAATYRAFVTGHRIELSRVVPLLESFLAATDSGSASPEKFRSQLESLSYDVDEADIAAVAKAFPSIERERVRSATEVAAHGVKRDLLDRLQAFQDGAATSASDFRTWLGATRDRHANWFSRLKMESLSQP